MALTADLHPIPTGSAVPRLAPPIPIDSLQPEYVATATAAGIDLWPWQRNYAQYLMARNGERWAYPEICLVVARQNGKTETLIPRILWGLAHGRRIVHTAQNRDIPRDVFERVARAIDVKLLARKIRWANGQEKIVTKNGGSYKIIAPLRGARGLAGDDLIIDELREFEDFEFIGAAAPTLMASPDPQIIYLSNAGHDNSVVLNQLRDNGSDEKLCYLEWSASPDLDASDEIAWAQANPALGHRAGMYDNLVHAFASRPSALFETEHLCRWVTSMQASLVTDIAWRSCHAVNMDPPLRPALGVALDPGGQRASAALAWQTSDGLVAYQPVLDLNEVIDIDAVGSQLQALARRSHVTTTGYSGASDVALSRYLTRVKAVDGREFAQASSTFATLVEGRKIRWQESTALSEDLRYTIRKQHADGVWSAARAKDDHPITSAQAAIRAVWLAIAPRELPRVG
jgi:hypothetical protein